MRTSELFVDDHIIKVYTATYQLHISCVSALQRFSINDFKKMIRVVITQLQSIEDKHEYLNAWEDEINFTAGRIRDTQPEYKARPAVARLIKFTEYLDKQRDKLPPELL